MSPTEWGILSTAAGVLIWSCGDGSPGITNPPPDLTIVTTLEPDRAPAGSPDLILTLIGQNFGGSHRSSTVVWSAGGRDTTLATTFVNPTRVTALVPAALLRNTSRAQVFVVTSDRMSEAPPSTSNNLPFTVEAQGGSGSGALVVYGETSTVPPKMKGARQIELDGSGWRQLGEGDSVRYSSVNAGLHLLGLSNPCTGNHQPTIEDVTVGADSTVRVPVPIPEACE